MKRKLQGAAVKLVPTSPTATRDLDDGGSEIASPAVAPEVSFN